MNIPRRRFLQLAGRGRRASCGDARRIRPRTYPSTAGFISSSVSVPGLGIDAINVALIGVSGCRSEWGNLCIIDAIAQGAGGNIASDLVVFRASLTATRCSMGVDGDRHQRRRSMKAS